MRLLIAAVGRLKQGPERDLFAHYQARAVAAGRKVSFASLDVIEIPEARGQDAGQRLELEATALLAKLPAGHKPVALDLAGERPSSEDFAALLRRWRDDATPGVAFLIGGADGLGKKVLEAAALRLSLGPMTLTHGLARIVLAEQIYRAATILAGHPYHRG